MKRKYGVGTFVFLGVILLLTACNTTSDIEKVVVTDHTKKKEHAAAEDDIQVIEQEHVNKEPKKEVPNEDVIEKDKSKEQQEERQQKQVSTQTEKVEKKEEKQKEKSYKSLEELFEDRFDLLDTVKSSMNSSDIAKIYEASYMSITETSRLIQKHFEPQKESDIEGNRQVLIYRDYFVILIPKEGNHNHTTVELSTYGFVRDNYSAEFFDGLFLLYVLDDVLDVDDWHQKRQYECNDNQYGECYEGYRYSGGRYKGTRSTSPSLRGSSSFRGGGPSAGK